MEIRKIIVEPPVTAGKYILVPVVSLLITGSPGAMSFFGQKKPLAIVIKSADTVQSFSVEGTTVPLEELINKTPELGLVLDRI